VFPARNISIDPRSDITRRHHIDQSVINKGIKGAIVLPIVQTNILKY